MPLKDGNQVAFCAHKDRHIWPADATEHIVRFFQEHRLR